ncbi:LCP family protein [Hornefia butyriciproducens]|uniref:LCP family glycopolymer transferase n=1 Tax=Hornefia butyriciproducens TaxID=2652293 RepID=UPI002A90C2ED|nr:LCP family protein [Hornefia butyriciproducens]MDY5423151.1 LCP family protein [Hornefia butyriciproducens]
MRDLPLNKKIILLAVLALFAVCLAFDIQSGIDTHRAKEIKKAQAEYNLTGVGGCSDIVLINTGMKDARDIADKDIQNIMVVSFEDDARKAIQLTSLKRMTYVPGATGKTGTALYKKYSAAHPENLLDAVQTMTGFRTDAYLAINDRTIIRMVRKIGVIQLNIDSDEIAELNRYQKILARKFHLADYTEITQPGIQPVTALQAAAYALIGSDAPEKSSSDRHARTVVRKIIRAIHGCSMADMEEYRHILMTGDNNFRSEYSMQVAARLEAYKLQHAVRWPQTFERHTYHGTRYVFPVTAVSNARHLQIDLFEGTKFKAAREMRIYDKKIREALRDIEAIRAEKEAARMAKEKAEKEAAEKAAKEKAAAESKQNKSKNDSGGSSGSGKKKPGGDSGNSSSGNSGGGGSGGSGDSGNGNSGGGSGSGEESGGGGETLGDEDSGGI